MLSPGPASHTAPTPAVFRTISLSEGQLAQLPYPSIVAIAIASGSRYSTYSARFAYGKLLLTPVFPHRKYAPAR